MAVECGAAAAKAQFVLRWDIGYTGALVLGTIAMASPLLNKSVVQDRTLNQNLKTYLMAMPVSVWEPTKDFLFTAVSPYFPELLKELSAEEILEEVGLPVIAKVGKRNFAYSVAVDSYSANQQLIRYQQEPFPQIRTQLGIDAQWIFQTDDEFFWQRSTDSIVDCHLQFVQMGQPSICIIPF
jgi:hypothetical protein